MKRYFFERGKVDVESFYVPLSKRASARDVVSIGFGLFVVTYLFVFFVIS